MRQNSKGYIVELELKDFKSYQGVNRIGPFKKFSAIIGPNGSGKSNIMDAISFVLGVRAHQLRGKLEELMHRETSREKSDQENANHTFVKLVFSDEDNSITEFKREIICSGGSSVGYHSVYKIGGLSVSALAYDEKLKSYGILVRARNFLVFQGDIESVASMAPRDLSNMFEQISGSISLCAKYNEALKAKNEAERRVGQIALKWKNITTEKKLKKSQRIEAQRYLDLLEKLGNAKNKFYNWKVYILDNEISAIRDNIKKIEKDLDASVGEYESLSMKIEVKKREIERALREKIQREKGISEKKLRIEVIIHAVYRIEEEEKRLVKRVENMKRVLSKEIERVDEWSSLLIKAKRDLISFENAKKVNEQNLERYRNEMKLSDEDMKEYQALKKQVMIISGQLQQQKSGLDLQQSIDQEDYSRKKQMIMNLEKEIESIENMKNELDTQKEGIRSEKEELLITLHNMKKERNNFTIRYGKEQSYRDGLFLKIKDLEKELREAKACRRENRRERKIAECVMRMKNTIPNVYGRVTDLSKVRQSRYNLAMAVAIGYNIDSVLVDREETAQKCISFLKENRYPPLTFLPLSSLQCNPLKQSFRQLGGTAKLAIDILEFDSIFLNGFLYICGNSIICDTYEEAKILCYQKFVNTKVVCLNGTMIHKGGLITGGISENVESRASRWDNDRINNLTNQLYEAEAELKSLPSLRDIQVEEQILIGEISKMEEKIRFLEKQMEVLSVKDKSNDLEKNKSKIEQITPSLEYLEGLMQERQKEIDKIVKDINKTRNRMFEDFSRRVGIENYELYEEKHVKELENALQHKREIDNQIEQLKRQIDYESSRDTQRAITVIEQKIQQYMSRVEEIKLQSNSLINERNKIKSDLEDSERQISQIIDRENLQTADMEELKNALKNSTRIISNMKREIDSKKNAIQTFNEQRNDIIQVASVELGTEFKKDFSNIAKSLKDLSSDREKQKIEDDFKAEISNLTKQLEGTAPNLKAFDQYKNLEEQEEAQSNALREAKSVEWEAVQEFNKIHSKRYEMYMEAFNYVSNAVDKIYQDLTRSDSHGCGHAALYLENDDEPFSYGVKYIAIPPSKRYREIEMLSGGEKSVVALALLFSIHEYQPSPFFILDEIDASLDAENVSRVADYIHQRTRNDKEKPFQSIVISLKDSLFSKADCLIGIAKDVRTGKSEVFTLDLERFET